MKLAELLTLALHADSQDSKLLNPHSMVGTHDHIVGKCTLSSAQVPDCTVSLGQVVPAQVAQKLLTLHAASGTQLPNTRVYLC